MLNFDNPRSLHGRLLATLILVSLHPLLAAGSMTFCKAGELELALEPTADGIRLAQLRDLTLQQEFLAVPPLPLFDLTLRRPGTTNDAHLTAEHGWNVCRMNPTKRRLELLWLEPADPALSGISIRAVAEAKPGENAFHWQLRVENKSAGWSVWRVVFPQLSIADLGTNAAVLFPRGPGEVQRGVWSRGFSYRGEYPGGWCSMQLMAAYRDDAKPTGLYVAMHDPWGSTKDLSARSATNHTLCLTFAHPAPNMGVAGNEVILSGEAVWRLFRGDWFDAGQIYKQWARREARWWPPLTRDGRGDTPRWMRELNVWTMARGATNDCVASVAGFQKFMGAPTGFHWYNWHLNPFDNDYPHYFPTKPGFPQGVAALRKESVFSMPYINGRLWDTRDRGTEDFEFTKVALPWATKQADGSPYIESYNSKETNGEPVRLGVMCPSSALWQGTISNIVWRLTHECGVSGVYIDQIAAAAPKLCLDPTHGHPLGGGHWWTEGYWEMLKQIRRGMPRDAMLTTECNSEPFIRYFDGYLTWHWQHDGQVPLFPAIYGGTVQMFGRSFGGGATKDLALRMKLGQELVFGEQPGWSTPDIIHHPTNSVFFRDLVRLRAKCSRYFYAGEMARPPRFENAPPSVKADWRWSGEWWVTTDAVLAGAWKLPAERKLLLLFVNVTEEPVTLSVRNALRQWGVPGRHQLREIPCESAKGSTAATCGLGMPVTFAPLQPCAWELTW